jgi:hypothetical protein
MIDFLGGAVTLAYVVAGVFFLRFWRMTRDPLFLSFAIAFWLQAVGQVAGAVVGEREEVRAIAFVPRIAGYLFILLAIVRANVRGARRRQT